MLYFTLYDLVLVYLHVYSKNFFLFILTQKLHWVNFKTPSLFTVFRQYFRVFRVFNHDGFNFCPSIAMFLVKLLTKPIFSLCIKTLITPPHHGNYEWDIKTKFSPQKKWRMYWNSDRSIDVYHKKVTITWSYSPLAWIQRRVHDLFFRC